MLNQLIAFSLKNRLLVVLGSLMVAVYGAIVSWNMPIDVLPDLNRPTVTIIAEAHAMVPENVEKLVSTPIERLLNGATGVTRVRSVSGLGMAVIYVEFGWGTDIFRNRQIVQEKLQLAQGRLPPDVQVQMAPIASIMGQVQFIGIYDREGKTGVSDVRALVDQVIKPRLMSVAGVAQMVAIGGASRQLQVTVSAEKLLAMDVTFEEVAAAVRHSNLNSSGGFLNVGPKGSVITVTGMVEGGAQIGEAVVRDDPLRPVLVRDVADVAFGPAAIRTGEAGVDGRPGVILVVFKQPGVDTVGLTDRMSAEVQDLRKSIPPHLEVVEDVFQQAGFIHRAIENVVDAVRDGAILVVLVLVAFLANLRITLITLTAIPLSVAVTAIIFAFFGLSINTMTLGGIAVAIGALVDDAIVDVENVYRRLRQNALKGSPLSTLMVIFRASSEVRKPILIGTILVVVVYLPLFFLTGLEGRLFTPIGVAYITSILASLVVSLTLTPALCLWLLGSDKALRHAGDNAMVRIFKKLAGSAIRLSLRHPAPILTMLGLLLVVAIGDLATRGSQFLPAFNEGSAQVNLILPPDTGLETSSAFGARLEKALVTIPGVAHVGRRTGRAEGDEHAEGVNMTEAIVSFDPEAKRSREQIVGDIRDMLAQQFPGVATEVEQPLAHLLSHLLSGVNAQIAIKIFGPDLEVLRGAASEVEKALKGISGVKDLYTQPLVLVDQVRIQPRREEIARHGLTVEAVAMAVELSGGGEEISRTPIGQISTPIVLRLAEEDRASLQTLQNLRIKAPGGGLPRLGEVADVSFAKTPNNITRENASRRAVVQCNVAERSLSEVVADIEKVLGPVRERLQSQPGYSVRLSGQFEAQEAATRLMAILSLVALGLMFLVLYMHFKSANLSFQVLLSIPMAFIGGVAWVAASGQTLSVATLVGFVSLGGIAARNTILLLDHYLHLMREEGEPFGVEMIVRAGQERMMPVLMTALCSGIALVPLVMAADKPGREILYPVATVILGGLISSTLLDFIVTPAAFWLLGRRGARNWTDVAARSRDELADELLSKSK